MVQTLVVLNHSTDITSYAFASYTCASTHTWMPHTYTTIAHKFTYVQGYVLVYVSDRFLLFQCLQYTPHYFPLCLQDKCVNDYTVFPRCNEDDSICNPPPEDMTGQQLCTIKCNTVVVQLVSEHVCNCYTVVHIPYSRKVWRGTVWRIW